ncbi:hypothetical protein RMQ97_07090 [Maricaulis sp. D1M11]|uniref:hypothetical protein n=1 Tax=Maricaulis sp. D1M11 TaxID=3076117 RepID=UPI0039B36FC3
MSFVLIDILPLKDGASFEQAVGYFETLKPVFERHGLRRVDQPLQPVKVLRGEVQADLVNLFETENPEVSLAGMRDDPDYQAQIELRDTVFDLDRASIVLTRRA